MNRFEGSGSEEGVDRLLTAFFQAEMPRPWPAFALPQPALARPARRWAPILTRFALAACVALLVVGYLTVAGMFGTMPSQAPDLLQNTGALIGSRPRMTPLPPLPQTTPQSVLTPGGNRAILQEEVIEGDRPTLIINLQGVRPGKDR